MRDNLPCYLAWVYAGLGEKEKALEQARRAIADYDGDALAKPYAEMALAIVEAQIGDIDSAIAALPHLLEMPNGETCGDLRDKSALGPAAQRSAFPKALRRAPERKLTTTRYVDAGKITRFMLPRRRIRPPRQTRSYMKTAVLFSAAALWCIPCLRQGAKRR